MEPRKLMHNMILVSFILLSFALSHHQNSADAFTEGELASQVDTDTDLFLEDEGSGHGRDDLESSGSGNGEDDEDSVPDHYKPPKKDYGEYTPGKAQDTTITDKKDKPASSPDKPTSLDFDESNVFDKKHESSGSFFSQPGILAAIICGAIVGLLCAILLVMFIVYRMRKKDEGSYVLEDSKRASSSYGKSKEFYA